MKTLEELIAQKEKLEREIEMIKSSSSEFAPTIVEPNSIGKSLRELAGGMTSVPSAMDDYHGTISINVSIDNSVRTDSSSIRETNIDTNLAGGDSALGMLGGLLGKIFD